VKHTLDHSSPNTVDFAEVLGVDVTVVFHNSAPHIERLVQSLAACADGTIEMNLHVVDNASHDDSIEVFRQALSTTQSKFAHVTIHESPTNLGFGCAHNRAAASGNAPFIFILNPDTAMPADGLRCLLAEAARSADDVAGWEPRQIPYEHPKAYDPVTMEPPWCSGAALLLRRRAFTKVGGFDECIFLYCEDVDLSWRLRDAGYRLRYVPSVRVRHDSYSVPNEIKPSQFIYSRLGNLYLRSRFGTVTDILIGLQLYMLSIIGSQHFHGQRRALLREIPTFFRLFPHFRWGANGPHGRHRVRGLNYEIRRGGEFTETVLAEHLPRRSKVSILVRTLGRRAKLDRALRSVANQTYRNLEVIVVEDGPATLGDFLSEFRDLDIVYHPLGENRGRCHAGNEAMNRASGEYLVFLDEDDEFYADHIEQLVAAALTSGTEVAYATAFEVPTEWDSAGKILRQGEPIVQFQQKFSRLALCYRNYLPILTVLFHRSLFERFGGMDPDLDNLEDWDLWLRFCAAGARFAFLNKTTSLYRIPYRRKDYGIRYQSLHSFKTVATAKQEQMALTMTVAEASREIGVILEDQSRLGQILGITPRELRGIEKLYTRHKLARWAISILRPVLRRLVLG